MTDDQRLDVLIRISQETGASLDGLELESRSLDVQDFKSWAGKVSMRLKNKKSSEVP